MFSVYRKRKNSLDSQWHYNTQCARWPEVDFVQVRFVNAEDIEGECFCRECGQLESEMFPRA